MAIKLLQLSGTTDYISKLDECKTEEEGASVYILGTLSSRQQGMLQDSSVEAVPDETAGDQGFTAKFKANDAAINTVRYALKGWRNVVDVGGNEVPFETTKKRFGGEHLDVVKESLLKRMPLELIRELAEKIQEANLMTEEVEKNSGA